MPSSIRDAVSMGYLLCRTADTIADSQSLATADRLKTLREFRSLFDSFPVSSEKLAALAHDLALSNTVPTAPEGRLMTRFEDAMKTFNRFGRTDQALIQQVVRAVITGMEKDLEIFGEPDGNIRALSAEKELAEYITWIGGEPGRFWTNVCFAHIPGIRAFYNESWVEDGVEFGRGLQMVNILRDLASDLKNGRCYIPAEALAEYDLKPRDLTSENLHAFLPLYHALIDQTIRRLEKGLLYLEKIPARYWGLRAAAWWPLAIALETLAKLRESKEILNPEKTVKITRKEIYWILLRSAAILPFNGFVRREFNKGAAAGSSSMLQSRHPGM